MSALGVFTYADQQIRTTLIDGEPCFLLGDVIAILGLSSTPAQLSQRLPDGVRRTDTITDRMGRRQKATFVTEAGLYRVVLRSDSPLAEPFIAWVTEDVLPTIRRTGRYGSSVDMLAALPAAELVALTAAVSQRLAAAETELETARPKAEAYDAFMDAEGYYPMDATARILGMGRTTLFRTLRDQGILQRGSNLPYRQYDHHFKVTTSSWEDKGGERHTTYTTRVRPSGIEFLRRKLGLGQVVAR